MSTFAKALSPAVREIRVHLCQTSPASSGIRDFIVSTYPALKKANPDLPILIREAKGASARLFARFERGVEKHVELDNLKVSDIQSKVTALLSS